MVQSRLHPKEGELTAMKWTVLDYHTVRAILDDNVWVYVTRNTLHGKTLGYEFNVDQGDTVLHETWNNYPTQADAQQAAVDYCTELGWL